MKCVDGVNPPGYRGRVTYAAPSPRAVLETVGVLGDDLRWSLFSFVRRSGRAVTREEAAAAVGISRKLAAFHLDKMVDSGVLRARYDAVSSTPRVGRRPKVYEPAEGDISLSIPGRQHQLLADLLLETVLSESREETGREAATRTARERGGALGAADASGSSGLAACAAMLEAHGYEPYDAADGVRLRNCPFHPLAAKAPELVCGMNHAFLSGYLDGAGVSGVEAVLDPLPGECCVRVNAAANRTPAGSAARAMASGEHRA